MLLALGTIITLYVYIACVCQHQLKNKPILMTDFNTTPPPRHRHILLFYMMSNTPSPPHYTTNLRIPTSLTG